MNWKAALEALINRGASDDAVVYQVVAAALEGKVLYESTGIQNSEVDAAVEFGLLVQVWPEVTDGGES